MSEPDATPPTMVEFSVSPEVEVGVYASFANLWHDSDVFTIDFSAPTAPPQLGEDPAGQPAVRVQARVVARVRIPPGQVFELMKALESQLSAWETETGRRSGTSEL
jgi:hypothetical protein